MIGLAEKAISDEKLNFFLKPDDGVKNKMADAQLK
jgi:hypothetical protein